MINNIPYLRKDTSTLLALSAIALLLSSPLLLFNPVLLQPVQAQTTITFKTPTPASGTDAPSTLAFEAQGTTTPGSSDVKVTGGTLQLGSPNGGQPESIDNFSTGSFTNDSSGGDLTLGWNSGGSSYSVFTECSASDATYNPIELLTIDEENPQGFQENYQGAVECSSSQGGGNTTTTTPTATDSTTPQQQPSMTGSSQDRDRGSSTGSGSRDSNSTDSNSRDGDNDGIPDSSDKCPHNSHHRCFKEGSSTTSTDDQQPSSSSNGNGNQTR